MARRGGKNEVTLTFAGDADQLERAIAKANGSTDKFEGDIKQASKSAESSFDKIGNAAKSVGDDLDSTGRESARALDKMGDSARDLEKDLEKVGDSRQTFSRLRLSVEEVGVFKPDPRVYRLATRHFGAPPEAMAFVSANPWDTQAALANGFRAVRVNRGSEPDEYGLREAGVPELRDLAPLPALLRLGTT